MRKYLGMESLWALSLFFLLKIHKEGVKDEKRRIRTRLCRQGARKSAWQAAEGTAPVPGPGEAL